MYIIPCFPFGPKSKAELSRSQECRPHEIQVVGDTHITLVVNHQEMFRVKDADKIQKPPIRTMTMQHPYQQVHETGVILKQQ